MAGPCIANTDCIELALDGEGNLTASPIIVGNPSSETWPFSVSSEECNGLHCSPDGLWVAPDHTCRALSASSGTAYPGVSGLSTTVLGVQIDLDTFEAAYGTTLKQVTTDATITYTNETCRTVNFWAAWATGPTIFQIPNGWWVALGTANYISSPNTGTSTTTPSVQVNLSDDPLDSTNVIGLIYPPAWYRVQSFLFPGEAVTVKCHGVCQVLAAGTPSGSTPNAAEFRFGVAANLEAYTRGD